MPIRSDEERQRKALDVLSFIIKYKSAHDGCAPSFSEVARGAGLSSASVAYSYLLTLQDAGLIALDADGHMRALRVAGGTWSYDPNHPAFPTSAERADSADGADQDLASRIAEHWRLGGKSRVALRTAHAAATTPEGVDAFLETVNRLTGGYGVESIEGHWVGKYYGYINALYVNMGDTYATTVLYDTRTQEFSLGSWGDWEEAREERLVKERETA